MTKYALIIFAALVLTLSACTRAASTAPIGTPTPDANFPQPVATTSMNAIELAGTQTAIATAGGMPMPVAGTVVVVSTQAQAPAGEPTYTPLAGIDTNPVVSTPEPSVTAEAPAANTAVPQPQAGVPVSNPGTYTLHEGEYPYCLARRFNVNPDLLLSQNGLSSGQSYYAPGARLSIPQSGGGFPGNRARLAHPTKYVVRSGDTIYSIACVFGDADPLAIVSANNLTGSYSLTTGSTIQIP